MAHQWMKLHIGRARRLAQAAADTDTPLPAVIHRTMRGWVALGWPGFLGVLAIFWLMVMKPA